MDIYILRNHRQIGPFSDDATQTLLRQGTVSAEDLAWRPGIPKWLPLGEVLNTLSSGTGESPSPPAVPAGANPEPATAQQTAFLSYFGIVLPEGITKEASEELISAATADPANAERLTQWNEERLRLHPDLFAAEVPTKKVDRVQVLLERCQTDGAAYFTGVTKAHCQVLVTALDVKFPRWDADEAGAVENYFFPAIAEKFPQLVNKAWRGRLHYREGAASATGATRKAPTARLVHSSTSPVAAIARGILLGLVILAALLLIHLARNGRLRLPNKAQTMTNFGSTTG